MFKTDVTDLDLWFHPVVWKMSLASNNNSKLGVLKVPQASPSVYINNHLSHLMEELHEYWIPMLMTTSPTAMKEDPIEQQQFVQEAIMHLRSRLLEMHRLMQSNVKFKEPIASTWMESYEALQPLLELPEPEDRAALDAETAPIGDLKIDWDLATLMSIIEHICLAIGAAKFLTVHPQ